MMLSMLNQVPIVAFAGLTVWAAGVDIRRLMIPNRIVAAIAALWLVHAALRFGAGVPAETLFLAVAVGAAAFAVGLVLFMLRLAGGGDVKLFAAVALWAGPGLIVPLALMTALFGGALAVGYLTVRTARNMTAATVPGTAPPTLVMALRGALKSEVPFGVAIAAGGLMVAFRLLFAPAVI